VGREWISSAGQGTPKRNGRDDRAVVVQHTTINSNSVAKRILRFEYCLWVWGPKECYKRGGGREKGLETSPNDAFDRRFVDFSADCCVYVSEGETEALLLRSGIVDTNQQ